MKHILKHIKVAKLAKEDLKTLKCHSIKMQAIIEGYIVDFAQVGKGYFVEHIPFVHFPAALYPGLLTGEVQGADDIHVLVSEEEYLIDLF